MNSKSLPPQGAPAKAASAPAAKSAAGAGPVAPLFRRIDWLALIITFAVVWVVYYCCLAPDVTLKDSGELCTASYYAGIPHPPGYPFWALYTWLWTVLVPFKNIAWRVALAEASTAALACGVLALMVSRGASMLMEGIEDLKTMTGKWENAICMVSGITSGLMLGLGSSMWMESVVINRISLFGVPWLLLVLAMMMRWIYAPHQRRYLYTAFFFLGICSTIHQTLTMAIMGIEIGVATRQPKLGRDLFFWNSILYLGGCICINMHMLDLGANMVYVIFHCVGIASIVGCVFLTIQTSGLLTELWTSIFSFLLMLVGSGFYFYEPIGGMTNPPMEWGYPRTVEGFWHALKRGQYNNLDPTDIFHDPAHFVTELGMLVSGLADAYSLVVMFFALLPLFFLFKIRRRDNAPWIKVLLVTFIWCVGGVLLSLFVHAVAGSLKMNFLADVFLPPMYLLGAVLMNFTFTWRMQKREYSWIITVAAIYPFLGVMLSIFLNPTRDKQTADLVKVFFTASHAVISLLIGYGMALIAAYMATNYEKFRRWAFAGGVVAVALAVCSLCSMTAENYFGLDGLNQVAAIHMPHWAAKMPSWLAWVGNDISLVHWFFTDMPHWIVQSFAAKQYGSPVIASLLLLGLTIVFLVSLYVYRKRAPLGITLALFAIFPAYSALSHWFKSEQHDHLFGYYFGHDMFTPPFVGPDGQLTYDAKLRDAAGKGPHATMVYPEMARDAVLFGGTDPGRFCPTYMIFCESFIPHDCQQKDDTNFDRRDVYLITQNALADPTYLDYIRAQFNRSAQTDPPFFQNFLHDSQPKLFGPDGWFRWVDNIYVPLGRGLDNIFETIGAKVERRRATESAWFAPDQFISAAKLADKLRPGADQDALGNYLYGKLSNDTQQAVNSKAPDETTLRRDLSRDLNALIGSENIYAPERFKNITLSPLIREAAATGTLLPNNDIIRFDPIIRLDRRMLEAAYPEAIVKSLGGVYPDTEIRTPTPDDSAYCYREYSDDAQRRAQHDNEFPNEPKQLRPGEDLHLDASGQHISVGGQTAVMAINGLLTKVIFDNNTNHEFYVEESFPLDWMYPYLSPFGVIMKINRHPIQELSQETIDKDHQFWSEYSQRTIGNWITYDTKIKDICDWAEAVYLRHDLTNFTGDPKFVRDEDAQKAFSKLRSSIAESIYHWRSNPQNSRSATERPRVTKEAEFAFKQAFAYCPYSPEVVFHLMSLLLSQNRVDEAIDILETCHKLDPYSDQITGVLSELKHGRSNPSPAQYLSEIRRAVASGQTGQAMQALDQIASYPGLDADSVLEMADLYIKVDSIPKAAQALLRLPQAGMTPAQAASAEAMLDTLLKSPGAADERTLMAVAENYLKMRKMDKGELAIQRITELNPKDPYAWYNLGEVQVMAGQTSKAVASLKKAFELNSAERLKNPQAPDLRQRAFQESVFAQLRQTPAFIAAFGSKP